MTATPRMVRIGRGVAVLVIAASVAVLTIHATLGLFSFAVENFNLHTAVLASFLAGIVIVALPRQPDNLVLWITLMTCTFQGIELTAYAASALLISADLGVDVYANATQLTPADLPLAAAWAYWLSWWAWVPGLFGFLTFGLLWFPNGRLPSPRWRWVAVAAGVGIALTSAGFAVAFLPGSSVPYFTSVGYPGIAGVLNGVGFPIMAAAMLASVASLFVRYRTADIIERHQLKWVGYGASLLAVAMTIGLPLAADALPWALLPVAPFVIAGYGVAILKYRLYDIDVVISRTVTYGALALFIAALYALVVVGLGSLLGRGSEPDLALSIGATALIAVLFEPIHSRVRRFANRIVYGERATPYAVLSTMTARMSAGEASAGPLIELAGLLARGTGADAAGVWLRVGTRLHRQAAWPAGEDAKVVDVDALTADLAVPVTEGGETLGLLTIDKPRTDPVTEADRRLLADVAGGAGMLLRNQRLNAELAARAEQLRGSRRRLVAAHDAERHRLERDLHDGAQQQVVALKVKLGLAKTLAEREGAEEVATLIGTLADDTQQAVDAMRTVARGIYPPLLEAEGLKTALASAQRVARIPVEVEANGLGRYARHVEETVYFCVLEAIEAATMSGAHGLRVGLTDRAGDMVVEIDHDGRAAETDFAAVSDRVDAYGGTTVIELLPGVGTRVVSRIPAQAAALEPA